MAKPKADRTTKLGTAALLAAQTKPPSVTVRVPEGGDENAAIAQTILRPTVLAASTIRQVNWGGEGGPLGQSIDAIVGELVAQSNAKDMKRPQEMLLSQAHTLDALFNSLVRLAMLNKGQYIGAMDTYLRLALKAQGQCRATLETLDLIKNPRPIAFVRQANITHGPQQVNNGTRAGENGIEQSKVLESEHGERLDTGAQSEASGADPALAAVGEVNRAEEQSGQSAREPQRLQRRRA